MLMVKRHFQVSFLFIKQKLNDWISLYFKVINVFKYCMKGHLETIQTSKMEPFVEIVNE